MKNSFSLGLISLAFLSLAAISILSSCVSVPRPVDTSSLKKSSYRVGVSVHDPSIVKDNGKYYIFGSHMESAVSPDLKTWKVFASGVSKYNKMFDNLFQDMGAFKYVGRNEQGSYSVWAPDVVYNPVMKKYMMYFCTTSSYVKSTICFATADSIEGPYTYKDIILYSGFTPQTVDQTNVIDVVGAGNEKKYFYFSKYKNTAWPNALDPSIFYDAEGRMWMNYGSWSGGMFILELDPATGYPIHPEADAKNGVDPYFGKHLAGGLHNSVEGPYILYDKVSGYYYLFVSYGALQSNGGYQIRMFRSKNPDGPYTDAKGESLSQDKAVHHSIGVKVMGNYSFPSLIQAYMAPGHNSAMVDENGDAFLVHHVRFDDGSEYHEPRVRRLFRTSDGWLAAAPFAYNGSEQLAVSLTPEQLPGTYFVVNHGTTIGPKIEAAEQIAFLADGRVFRMEGSVELGSWTYDAVTANATIVMNGETFTGVFINETDEAGNPVLVFTGIAAKGEALWAVRY